MPSFLPELHTEYQGEPDPDSQAQLALYRREIDQLLIPRYAKLAAEQNRLERSQGRGALYKPPAYVALFFALGLFVVWAPFIPIWEKWLPFALACLAPLISPWLPNLYAALQLRQHHLQLGLLNMDLDEAGRPLPPRALLLSRHRPLLPSRRMPRAAGSPRARRRTRNRMETLPKVLKFLLWRRWVLIPLCVFFGGYTLASCATVYVGPTELGVRQVYYGGGSGIHRDPVQTGTHLVIPGYERIPPSRWRSRTWT